MIPPRLAQCDRGLSQPATRFSSQTQRTRVLHSGQSSNLCALLVFEWQANEWAVKFSWLDRGARGAQCLCDGEACDPPESPTTPTQFLVKHGKKEANANWCQCMLKLSEANERKPVPDFLATVIYSRQQEVFRVIIFLPTSRWQN